MERERKGDLGKEREEGGRVRELGRGNNRKKEGLRRMWRFVGYDFFTGLSSVYHEEEERRRRRKTEEEKGG